MAKTTTTETTQETQAPVSEASQPPTTAPEPTQAPQAYPSSGGVFERNEDGTFTEKKD